MTAPMVDCKIHWLKMMSVPESRAVVGRHDGINGRDRQDKAEEVDLLPLATQIDHRLAKVCLGMARRVMQRHEGFACRLPLSADVVLHDGVAAGEAVLVPKPLVNGGAKKNHLGGVRRDRLAAAGLSP